MSRYARRTDGNQAAIVEALRGVPGVEVLVLSGAGCGVADLLVTRRTGSGTTRRFLEVKDGDRPPSARALTAAEERFAAMLGAELYAVVCSIDEALAAVGIG